tara:strand:- start:132 stop:512 length:381 start_codon:yes stop_codon:yes gene_type:complete
MKNGNQGDGGGRPEVVFSEAQANQIEALASVLTKGQIADYFNISETTLRAIEERQPEVSDAYKKGRVKAFAGMGQNLIKMAQAGNVAANIFYLKTQAGWKEAESEVQEIPQINIMVDPRAVNPTAE